MIRVALFLVLFFIVPGAAAQDEANADVECAAAVLRALTGTGRVCAGLEDGQVCYGHASAGVTGAEVSFVTPGDRVLWSTVETLESLPILVEDEQMGMAEMKLGGLTFIMMGELELRRVLNDTMPAFTLQTGAVPECYAANNTLLIQSVTPSSVWINSVEFLLDGTVAVWATPNGEMDVRVLAGKVDLTARQTTQSVNAGQAVSIPLGDIDGLMAAEMPEEVEPFDPELTATVPIRLLDTRIEIPAQRPWTNAGVIVKAGEPYTLIASGVVSGECGGAGCESFFLPDSFADKCQQNCQLVDAPYIQLIGRIGGGEPFSIGYGGTFTPETGGTLELGVNDSYFDDNAGAFHALITAPLISTSTCFIRSEYLVAMREGAGIEYPVHRELLPDLLIQADGVREDTQNRPWWRLTDGGWLLAEVVEAIGDCAALPEI